MRAVKLIYKIAVAAVIKAQLDAVFDGDLPTSRMSSFFSTRTSHITLTATSFRHGKERHANGTAAAFTADTKVMTHATRIGMTTALALVTKDSILLNKVAVLGLCKLSM